MVTLVGLFYTLIYSILGVISLIVLLLIWKKTFSYKVRIRELTGSDVKIIRDALGKVKKDREKVDFVSLWFGFFRRKPLPNQMPLPPADAIDYDALSNRKVIEAWYDEEIGYTYAIDKVKAGDFKMNNPHVIFEPFPTKHRSMLINQIHKKESKRPHNVWKENFPVLVGGLTLVLILTVLLIFWGKAVEPMQKLYAQGESIIERADQILEKAIAYDRGVQVVEQTAPPEGG